VATRGAGAAAKDAYRAFTDDRQFETWLRNDDVGSGYLPVGVDLNKAL
jgi:hypothetical protein